MALRETNVAATGLAIPSSGAEQLKLQELEERLRQIARVMIAYSGGVDSAFLAATAHRVLGDQMLAVLADSASLARSEFGAACDFAAQRGIPLRIINTHELSNPDYFRNDADRCFHCKDELFRNMLSLGRELGFEKIAYGMNADDTRDYRPGQRAATLHGVLAPLADAGLTKAEIRSLAQQAGFAPWEKPAAPCLSSRVAYGLAVTREVLAQIETAQASLRSLGFREFRVRHHGEIARIEIARGEMGRALTLEMFDALTAAVRAAGYQYVALDTAGFHSGSLNQLLPVEVLRRADPGN